jgi:UDP-N-acetylmuramyl pentapeptide synthase
LSDGNIETTLAHGSTQVTWSLPMPGAHNALNAAAALAVANELGVSLQDAATALQNVEVPVPVCA